MNVVKFKFLEVPRTLGFSDREALLNILLGDMQRNGFNILSVKDHSTQEEVGFMIEYRETE